MTLDEPLALLTRENPVHEDDLPGPESAAALRQRIQLDDATFVGTESPLAEGRSAIPSAFAQSFPVSNIESIDSKELVVSGDVAYDYGTFRQVVTMPNAKPQTINGHYLVTLKRQGDGTWKITRHVSTTPPAKP